MTEQDAILHNLHKLWTWSVGKEGYDKESWMDLSNSIHTLLKSKVESDKLTQKKRVTDDKR